ncbi:helix-turn-helix domain-containing protein [Anaerococcus nagyae]|uniref:helix-turn-helix domain-containing protein n=1 Tax=Anaerococcus nagyae TaxID=1755241 RepID=UPI00324C326B
MRGFSCKNTQKNLKLKYLSGETGGHRALAKNTIFLKVLFEGWIVKYNSGGFANLTKKKNNKYTNEFKLSVIQYRKIYTTSLRQTAEYFNIVNGSMIYRWEKAYQKSGLSGLEDNRGRPRKNMSKADKKFKNEKPIEESEREENKYLKMQILFEKKFQALLLEEEAEARKEQR